ncbi:hypothetical protein RHMOL_Rhmol04G0342500 [Rhododendron molle]|uniref:Uncharacterized protein n=1 Tax=Rhododendron molle TaxID=49168 RepID=A0ACC0P719_RHOML|nr:hypothetical protein RHMOL_Rhmol04G0342500 [Rhododendron molle]
MGIVIVYFDATEENSRRWPNLIVKVRIYLLIGWLLISRGCLCVVKFHGGSHADVRVMKEYGVKESWTKLFVIPNEWQEFYSHDFIS